MSESAKNLEDGNNNQDLNRPSVYTYDNYRTFINDMYLYLKKSQLRGFTHRMFSELAGFSSSSMLKKVVESEINLNSQTIVKFSVALSLKSDEQIYFTNLVMFNQSKNSEEKRFYANQMMNVKSYRDSNPHHLNTADYLSHWYFVAIRELVAIKDFEESTKWISQRLTPRVSAFNIKRAIKKMLEMGVLKRDAGGKLIQSDQSVLAEDMVTSQKIHDFHEEMIERARESVSRFTRLVRVVQAVTIPLEEESFKQLEQAISRFGDEVMAISSQAKNPTDVYQFNLQLFPMTRPVRKAGQDE